VKHSLTPTQDYKDKAFHINKKAQEAARYYCFARFRDSGPNEEHTYISINMLAFFEKFQFAFVIKKEV
jgi:hypothetical protein